jgi:small GTP-binding protein
MSSSTSGFYKIVLLGDTNVGKTSLLRRFNTDCFDSSLYPTTGETFIKRSLQVGHEEIMLHLWDTPGQEKFASQSTLCIRDAHCCLICYDVEPGAGTSYDLVDTFISRYTSTCVLPRFFAVIVGNKSDRLTPAQQQREMEKLEPLENEIRVKSFLTSAKSGEGVHELFQFIGSKLVEFSRSNVEQGTVIKFQPRKPEDENGCC